MTNKREPLWSDIRIRDRYHALVPCEANMGEMEYWNVLRDVGERVSYELRNDYEVRITELEQKLSRAAQYKGAEAYPCPLCRYEDGIFVESCAMHNRIAELEAQLAQTWQPLPDGEVSSFIYIDNGGKLLGVFAGDDYTDWYATEDLPDNIRLCRLVERAEPQSNGWKSANESLPEGHAWVLVYADGAIDCMGYSPDKGFEDWTEQRAPNVNISEITHWKELQRPTEVDHE